MGCSSSSAAGQAQPQLRLEEGNGELRFKSETLTTRTSTYNPKAQARKPLLKSSSYLGLQLLSLAKAQPAVGPVAFLLGTCIRGALAARDLKLDCALIARMLQQVEGALINMGTFNTAAQLEALELLRVALDDTAQVLHKLKGDAVSRFKDTHVINAHVAEITLNGTMGKLRDKLVGCLKALDQCKAATENVQQLEGTTFTESTALTGVLEEVAADIGVKAGSVSWTQEQGQAILQKATERLDRPDGLKPTVSSILKDIFLAEQAPNSPAKANSFSPGSRARDPLEVAEYAETADALYGPIMSTSIKQMQAMIDTEGMGPNEFLKKWPLPADEPDRLLFIQKMGLTEVAPRVDVSDIIAKIQKELGTAYIAAYLIGWDRIFLMYAIIQGGLLGKPDDILVAQTGLAKPRKFSICQHTISQNETIYHQPLDKLQLCFDERMFSNASLVAADGGVASSAPKVLQQTDAQMQEFLQVVQKGNELVRTGVPFQHAGTAIVVEGRKVGALCMLYPSANWKSDSDTLLLSSADQVAGRLKAAAQAAGFPNEQDQSGMIV